MARPATLEELRERARHANIPVGTILRAQRMREQGVELAQVRAAARRRGELRVPRPVDVEGVVWRVATCAPSEALALAEDLEALGWRVCCPIGRKVVQQARLGPGKRGRKVIAYPVFAGYLFVGEVDEPLTKRAHGRISGVVSDLSGPLRVSKDAIKAISDAECRGKWDHTQRVAKFATGATVRITSGPFADFQAVVEGVEQSGVLRLSAMIFGRPTIVRADPLEIVSACAEAA